MVTTALGTGNMGQERTPATEGAAVAITQPADGAVVTSPDTPMDQPLPFDDNHRHFGGGQTQATLELEPGEHTLQLLFADWQHFSCDPPILSEKISITVA